MNLRLLALTAAASLLPAHGAAHNRARLFAKAGFRVGAGTLFHGTPRISGNSDLFDKLTLGVDCVIGESCTFGLEERIAIGDRVVIGPGVMLLTTSSAPALDAQSVGPAAQAAIVIGDGALLGARSVVLPGVTVGRGAVITPGSVVDKDVLPNTRVGGVPARQIEVLNGAEPAVA